MTPPLLPGRVLPPRVLAATALAAAGGQLVLAAWSFWPALQRIPGDVRRMTVEPPPSDLTEGMLAFRALPFLLQHVPPTAPVLVVSTLAAVQFEYFVLPRPMLLLQALPPSWIDLVRANAPALADEVERRRDRLDRRGLLLTQARLRAAVDGVGHVLVAGPDPAELAAVRARLEPVAQRPGFVLYAVR
jgi:hypothetical protein